MSFSVSILALIAFVYVTLHNKMNLNALFGHFYIFAVSGSIFSALLKGENLFLD